MDNQKLPSLRTYKSSFRVLATGFVITTFILLAVNAVLTYYFYTLSQDGYKSIWIVDPKSQTVINAVKVNKQNNPEREFEYRNHVTMFYKLWYELDQFSYKRNIDRGLNLIGNSGKILLSQYNQSDLIRKLQENNMKITVEVDSVLFDMNKSPVIGVAFAKQTFKTPGGEIKRYLNAKFNLFDLETRSNENPHGVLIENFQIINSNTIVENERNK